MAVKNPNRDSSRTLDAIKKKIALPASIGLSAKRLHEDHNMDTLTDSDRVDLVRLENIVRRCNNIGTAALSEASGINSERISFLCANHFCSVSRKPDLVGSSIGDVWTYTPTMADKAAEQESHEQQDKMERQRHQVRVPPF